MAIIVIPSRIEEKIRDLFDTDQEVAAWFLAEKRGRALVVHTIENGPPGQEGNVSPLQMIPEKTLQMVKRQRDRYELLSRHLHTRSYGSTILPFDPYWTITVNDGQFSPGQIVDGKFYVSRKYAPGQDGGDSLALERLVDFGRAREVDLSRTLFIHPSYGQEGKPMHRDLVDIRGYEYDPSQRFRVKDIPISIGPISRR